MALSRTSWSTIYTMRSPCVGFPDKFRITLKYVASTSFSASATPAAQVYRPNGLFDIDLTGTGSQPLWYDQITAIYQEYVVLGAEAEVDLLNNSTTVPAYAVALYTDVNQSSLAHEALEEFKYSKKLIMGISGAAAVKKLRLPYITTEQIQGEADIEGDPNFWSAYTTVPTDQWFLIIKVAATDGVSNVNVTARTTIYMDVVFKGLTPLNES